MRSPIGFVDLHIVLAGRDIDHSCDSQWGFPMGSACVVCAGICAFGAPHV